MTVAPAYDIIQYISRASNKDIDLRDEWEQGWTKAYILCQEIVHILQQQNRMQVQREKEGQIFLEMALQPQNDI